VQRVSCGSRDDLDKVTVELMATANRFASRAGAVPTKTRLRQNNPTGKLSLNLSGKSPLQIRPVSPDERGGSRSSRTRGGMRWTGGLRLTSASRADGEAVWS